MDKLFRLLLVVAIISSCSKNTGGPGSSTQVLLPDTLSTGWSKLTSLPAENFTDILFTDNTNGYAVSNNGIYRSVNSGDAWTKINTAIHQTSISAGNSNNACITDGAYSVLVTGDAGNTFSNGAYTYPGGGAIGFYDCFFSGPNTCYFSSFQYLWKSVNAGVSIDTVFHFSTISPTSSLFFLNDLDGWIMRQDGLYQTTDGGDNWIKDTTLTNAYGSVEFIDNNTGYFSNYGTINKTTDGGITWLPVFQSDKQAYGDIDFININDGYFSLGNKIYKTSDAGSTWTQVVELGNEFINRIHFTDTNHGWACTSDGTVVRYAP